MHTAPLTTKGARRRVPRQAPRYPVRWAVTEINGKPAQDAWVVDVSCVKARLETTFALGPNTPVNFQVTLPDGTRDLRLKGRVIWMRPIFSQPGRYHQGVQFHRLNCDLDRLGKRENLPAD
ncbi:MAG: PilZ domain-containing protein [Thermodesulfobacteriota bacterium]